jgi:hypothetical protein
MVTNVAGVPRPRIISGIRPLAERWTDTLDYAAKVIPENDVERACLTLSISEINLDKVNDAIVRSKEQRYALVEPSPELRKCRQELFEMRRTYEGKAAQLRELQKRWIWRARNSWQHRLLRSLRPDMYDEPPALPAWNTEDYPDPIIARQAAKKLFEQVQRLESLIEPLANAAQFDGLDEGPQALHLAHALYDDSIELKNRVIALEAQVSALQAQLSKSTRSTKLRIKSHD